MRHAFDLRVGPISFRLGSDWAAPLEALRCLYVPYPRAESPVDFTVRLEAASRWRRFVRPSIAIGGDFALPGAAPLSLAHGLLAAELGMNLQMALGERRFLLLHAATVEKDGQALLMTGESGAGKSTLAALLGEHGWRLMGDEFALLDPAAGSLHPFPRAISLKNRAINLFADTAPDRLGPLLENTPKGSIRHLRPAADAIERMDEPASPRLILFPRFAAGAPAAMRPVGAAEVFARLTNASTNYVALGEPAFTALGHLVTNVRARAIDYSDTRTALRQIDRLWQE